MLKHITSFSHVITEAAVCVCVCVCVGLAHLCEFIEDCEHVELATRILHLLGREGPRSKKPHSYIRFIYNRVLLEAPEVRAGGCGSRSGGCD